MMELMKFKGETKYLRKLAWGLSFKLNAGRMWLVKGYTFDGFNIISVVKRNGNIVDSTSLGSVFLAGS